MTRRTPFRKGLQRRPILILEMGYRRLKGPLGQVNLVLHAILIHETHHIRLNRRTLPLRRIRHVQTSSRKRRSKVDLARLDITKIHTAILIVGNSAPLHEPVGAAR